MAFLRQCLEELRSARLTPVKKLSAINVSGLGLIHATSPAMPMLPGERDLCSRFSAAPEIDCAKESSLTKRTDLRCGLSALEVEQHDLRDGTRSDLRTTLSV